jgi:hypothetical protein
MKLPSSGRKKVDDFIIDIVASNPEILEQYIDYSPENVVDFLRKSYNRIEYKKKQRLKKRKH